MVPLDSKAMCDQSDHVFSLNKRIKKVVVVEGHWTKQFKKLNSRVYFQKSILRNIVVFILLIVVEALMFFILLYCAQKSSVARGERLANSLTKKETIFAYILPSCEKWALDLWNEAHFHLMSNAALCGLERTLKKYFISTEGWHLRNHISKTEQLALKQPGPSNSTIIIRSKAFSYHTHELWCRMWNVNRLSNSTKATPQDIAARAKHTSQKPRLTPSLLANLPDVVQQRDVRRWVKQMARRQDKSRRDGRVDQCKICQGWFAPTGACESAWSLRVRSLCPEWGGALL